MAFNITVRHPLYGEFKSAWELMRDAVDGEDAVKVRGETYLPMKSGTAEIQNLVVQAATYAAYKTRAEFPELVAPTIRGAVGTMLDQAAKIELPSQLEPLRERATRDGKPLDVLHRDVATEVMITGRYGLLPGVGSDGSPYIASYSAENIINWDVTDDVADYVVLNESAKVRNRESGAWEAVERYLECRVENGAYVAREWVKGTGGWTSSGDVVALRPPRNGRASPLDALPFVFINTNGLTPNPDDVPLYGLAKVAIRIYRMDADYTFSLHMTSEPTPVAIGFDNPVQAVKDGIVPSTLGSSNIWILPPGGEAKYLEFSGPGLSAQHTAIQAALDRAVALGAQILAEQKRTAESGEALKLRLGNQASVLKLVAQTTAAGLEKVLKNLAVWVGANPEKVKVEPNLDFFDHTLSAQEISAIVKGWQDGAYSWATAFERLQKGGVIPIERESEEEEKLIAGDDAKRGVAPDQVDLMDPVTGKPIRQSLLPAQVAQ